ncbi:MAG: hypothetical protein HOP08_08330 [Cyclobacteriaceae bacterium]|nr:hypothetical protein [Cyclobacteriaceae bacterium]
MAQLNKKVEAYIRKAAAFAKPILTHLRHLIHETCPDVEEDIKWGTPHYSYKGDHLCMLGGFKNHCSFSLYKAEMMKDPAILDSVKAGKKFGDMDKIKDISDLPTKKVLIAYIKEAMVLNESGVKKVKQKSETPKVIQVPDYFVDKLTLNKKAKAVWDSKSDSFRKDYLVWIIDAKTEGTRQKRIEESLAWLALGKGRFWKYDK